MRFNKTYLACLVLGGTALLSACGGGGDSTTLVPVRVVSADLVVDLNPTTGAATVPAILNQPFIFSTGVPDFGTTTSTTLTLGGTGAAPTFAVASAEGAASGDLTFSSCNFFANRSSTFATGRPLALNSRVVVRRCEIKVKTRGLLANGISQQAAVTFQLNDRESQDSILLITINPNGQTIIGTTAVGGLLPTADATGAGG